MRAPGIAGSARLIAATAMQPRTLFNRVQRQLKSGTLGKFALSMSSAILARIGLLLLAIIVARNFGTSDYGAFTFATSTALIVAQVAVLGWPILMNRLIPEFVRDENWGALRGLRDAGDWLILSTGVIGSLILWLLVRVTGQLGSGFLLSAILVIPFAFAIMRRQQLTAVRLSALGLLFDQGFGALIAAGVLFAIGVSSIEEAVAIFAGAMMLGIVITTVIFNRRLPAQVRSATRDVQFWTWTKISIPLFVGMSAKLLMNKADILMLAPLAGLHESGLYGAAFRITFLLTFPQMVMMTVLTPLISEAFAKGEEHKIKPLLRMGLWAAAATAIPASLPLILFPGPIMAFLFGEAFREAAIPLALLTIGQLASSFASPMASLLMMGGREKAYGTLNAVGFGCHILMNFALIPLYGAVGAAISTMVVSLLLWAGQMYLKR